MPRITAGELIDAVLDPGSFRSWDRPPPPVAEPGEYAGQLDAARERSGVDESVLTGEGTLAGRPIAVILSEFNFLAGTTGRAASERIVCALERAAAERLPIFASPTSGGTRMQEGTHAFLQLVKISQALTDFRRAGLPYLVYIRDPMTGGPVISWGALGQVTLAEPEALIGLLGPRVVEVLTGERLPEGVQTAENLAKRGIVDRLVPRSELRAEVEAILQIVSPPHVRGLSAPTGAEPRVRPAWDSVEASARPNRPRLRDLIGFEAETYVPLLGTHAPEYRGGIVVGLAQFRDFSCMLIGHSRDSGTDGVLTLSGLAAARRGFEIADEMRLPILTIIDTPGVEVTAVSEEGGMAREIARTVEALTQVRSPVVSAVCGAGTGVSALTLLPADRTICAENAFIVPLPLEAASEILHRSTAHAPRLAARQGIRASDLVATGLVDEIVPEAPDASAYPAEFSRRLIDSVATHLYRLVDQSEADRLAARRRRYREVY